MNSIVLHGVALTAALAIMLSGCGITDPSQLLPVSDVSKQVEASQLITVSMPDGPSAGKVDEVLTYTVGVNSSLDGKHSYGFYWGDGSYTWSTTALASHSWPTSGMYTVRVKVKCGDVVSEWSHGKLVMIGSAVLSRRPLNNPAQAQRYVTPDAEEVKSAVNTILSSPWRRYYSDFDALREWVASNVQYKRDPSVYGYVDYWQLPIETLECGTGDCEDIAILLCSMLRASGVPPNEIYVAIGCPPGTNTYHAYLFERHSKGVWRMIEPQIDFSTSVLSFEFLDWALTSDYSSNLICFNDRYFFAGPPALGSGVYETELAYSLWPILKASSVKFERKLEAEDRIEGSVEWVGNDKIMFDWNLTIYGPDYDVLLTWNGKDLQHDFTLRVITPGVYTLEILKRDFVARFTKLKINPPDWKKASN